MGGAAPVAGWHAVGVVEGEVVLWKGNVYAFVDIAVVFAGQGHGVVFEVAGHEDFAVVVGFDDGNACFGAFCQDCEVRVFENVFLEQGCVARLRNREGVVKSAQKGFCFCAAVVHKNAGKFAVETVFLDSVKVVKAGKASPADIKG